MCCTKKIFQVNKNGKLPINAFVKKILIANPGNLLMTVSDTKMFSKATGSILGAAIKIYT